MDGYRELANGIILQAAEDYRKALRALGRNKDSYAAEDIRKEVERFFRSDWFGMLTDLDPERLIAGLREECGVRS